jgi:hypothetical protein
MRLSLNFSSCGAIKPLWSPVIVSRILRSLTPVSKTPISFNKIVLLSPPLCNNSSPCKLNVAVRDTATENTQSLRAENLMSKPPLSRRQFMQIGSGAIAATTIAKKILQPHLLAASPRPVAPSDTVRFASIGTGIRGCEHLQASLSVPGIQCVAVCDLYDSRHTAAQEDRKSTRLNSSHTSVPRMPSSA